MRDQFIEPSGRQLSEGHSCLSISLFRTSLPRPTRKYIGKAQSSSYLEVHLEVADLGSYCPNYTQSWNHIHVLLWQRQEFKKQTLIDGYLISALSTPSEPDCLRELLVPWPSSGRARVGFHLKHLCKNWNHGLSDICTLAFTGALLSMSRREKQPECPSANEWINKMSTSLQWGIN